MNKAQNRNELLKSLAAIGIALLIGALFILLSGESPLKAYGALLKGALGSPKSIANTISKSIPLAFTGLAVALGSRAASCRSNGRSADSAWTVFSARAAGHAYKHTGRHTGWHGGRQYSGHF